MTNSRHIAGLLGPTMIALMISESEFVQPHLYDTQIAPVVYLSGTLLLIADLLIVRVHNRWTLGKETGYRRGCERTMKPT